VNLPDEDDDIVGCLLPLMYGFDHNNLRMSRDEYVKVYALAYRLDVLQVAAILGHEFASIMEWSDATRKGLDEDFVKYVKIAYTELPEEETLLKRALVEEATRHLEVWTFSQLKKALGPAFVASGAFAVEVMSALEIKKITLW
jgi:hypothetical protein